MTRKLFVLFASFASFVVSSPSRAETIRLPATADIWLSDATPTERESSMGAAPRLKLKGIQELAALRFDPTPLLGRKVTTARLFLKKAGDDKLRYLRLSTINQDWSEGKTDRSYGPPDGATWHYADANTKKPWAWPGSGFCDVIMTSGHSLASYAEKRDEPDHWISVDVPPTLVYALALNDTDGLAIMDGGNLAMHNNFFFSHEQKDSAPYLQVDVAEPLRARPPTPKATARPTPQSAHLTTGAAEIQITPTPQTFCYRITLNNQPLPRWHVPHPRITGILPVKILLDNLTPNQKYKAEIIAVSESGHASPTTTLEFTSSPALPAPPKLAQPAPPTVSNTGTHLSILPPLVKTSPDHLQPLNEDLADPRANSLFDGQTLHLAGARNETVSFQVGHPDKPIAALSLADFKGAAPQPTLDWYQLHPARNKSGKLQPAYLIPSSKSDPQSQAYAEIYIPKTLAAGRYSTTITIDNITIPLELTVYDFTLPDRLSFWPELNAYRIPDEYLQYFALAHDNRCVANFWKFSPKIRGQGANIKVDWTDYDRQVAPLLSGNAFKNTRRGPIPVECMYLPYADNWPTNLTQDTYHYEGHWPGRGEDKNFLVEHSLTAPPIEQALSPDYKAAFTSVQKQFLDHFQQQGWTQTEMQLYFGGKQTHRINFGSNMWWTTDEPSYLHDWLALRFFHQLWTTNLTPHLPTPSSPHLFPTRADISRPHWQGDFLDDVTNVIYYGAGAASSPAMIQRINNHRADNPNLKVRFYGSCNPDDQSNLITVAWILDAYLNGADGVVPWQTLGSAKALENNDASAFGGNALLIPVDDPKTGPYIAADLRLKAMRDGQQLIECLHLLAEKRHLNREQLKAMVERVLPLTPTANTTNPTADTDRFPTPKEYQLESLRRAIADLIVNSN